MRLPLFENPADHGAVIRQRDPSFLTKKELTYVRILDPEIYVPPGSGNLKAKGGLSPASTSQAKQRIEQGGRLCENVRIRLGAVFARANHSVKLDRSPI